MTISLRAIGDWGGADPANVEAVARSAASTFGVADGESRTVLLEPVAREDDSPITLFDPNERGEVVVRLNGRGNLWARLAYQFAHEYCHVLADIATFSLDRFTWIEEALCETGSLFALRSMAREWAIEPPYPNWRDYAAALERYAQARMSDPAHVLPPDLPFAGWLATRLPDLEANPGNREDSTVIAKELLPVFEKDAGAWEALRVLHSVPRTSSARLGEFLDGWNRLCPAAEAVASRIRGVDPI